MSISLGSVLKMQKVRGAQRFDSVALGLPPRPHQCEGLKLALKDGTYGLWDAPGTGKSYISYMYSATSIGVGRKVLAIMPPGLCEQYEEKFRELVFISCSSWVLNQTPAKRKEKYAEFKKKGWPDLLVVGYQMFLRERKNIPDHEYRTIVVDEAHALKNPSSNTYKVFKDFSEGAKVLYMTGSPAPTTPEDAYGLISLLTPDAYRSKAAFDRQHLVKTNMGRFRVTVGYKNLETLSENLHRKGRVVTKEDCLDLKVPNMIEETVRLESKHRDLYKKFMQERILEVGDELINGIQAAGFRRHATCLTSFPSEYLETKTKLKSAVVQRLEDILDSVNVTKNKVVIFANYVDTVERLRDHLQKLNPATIYSGSKTEENKRKFVEDDTCRVVIINPQAGGVGLDGLQKVSHNVIFFEPLGSPGLFDQCCSRLVRSGQKNVVNVYIMKVMGTVYVRSVETLLGRTQALKETVIRPGALLEELLGSL